MNEFLCQAAEIASKFKSVSNKDGSEKLIKHTGYALAKLKCCIFEYKNDNDVEDNISGLKRIKTYIENVVINNTKSSAKQKDRFFVPILSTPNPSRTLSKFPEMSKNNDLTVERFVYSNIKNMGKFNSNFTPELCKNLTEIYRICSEKIKELTILKNKNQKNNHIKKNTKKSNMKGIERTKTKAIFTNKNTEKVNTKGKGISRTKTKATLARKELQTQTKDSSQGANSEKEINYDNDYMNQLDNDELLTKGIENMSVAYKDKDDLVDRLKDNVKNSSHFKDECDDILNSIRSNTEDSDEEITKNIEKILDTMVNEEIDEIDGEHIDYDDYVNDNDVVEDISDRLKGRVIRYYLGKHFQDIE